MSLLILFSKIEAIYYSDEFIGDDVACIVMGWGFTNQKRHGLSNDILELKVPTITNEKCRQAGIIIVDETEICTISKENEGFCGVSLYDFFMYTDKKCSCDTSVKNICFQKSYLFLQKP